MEREIINLIQDIYDASHSHGKDYSGMTYEDGIQEICQAIIDYNDGEKETLQEILSELKG